MNFSSAAAQVCDATSAILDDVIVSLTMTPTGSPAVTSAVLRASGIRIDTSRVGLEWDGTALPDPRCAAALNQWTNIESLESVQVRHDIGAGQQQDLRAIEAERAAATRSRLTLFGRRERRNSLIDAALDVLAALRALPVFAADFPTVFADLASVAGLAEVDGVWQLTDSVGRPAHISITDLGSSVEDLARETSRRAAELSRDRDLIAAFVHSEIHQDGGHEGDARVHHPGRGGRLARLLADPARYLEMPSLPWTEPEPEPLKLLWRMNLIVARQQQAEQQAKVVAAEAAQRSEERYQRNFERFLERERHQRVEHEMRQRAFALELSELRVEQQNQQDDPLGLG